MKLIARILPVTLFFLGGCAGTPKKTIRHDISGDQLFPAGTYTHDVHLLLKRNSESPQRDFDFRGVVVLKEEAIKIVVLSPFGTTLFRMSEDRKTGEIRVESFMPDLDAYKEKMREYYADLGTLLKSSKHPKSETGLVVVVRNEKEFPSQLRYAKDGHEVSYTFTEFDTNGVPGRLQIEGSKFNVDVKVTGYEL